MGAGVGSGVGSAVGTGVGSAVGDVVGFAVGAGVSWPMSTTTSPPRQAVPAKTKAKAIISAANRSNFFFIICLLNKVRRRSASPRKKQLRQRRVNSPPRELRSRGWFSCLFPSGMFPEKQADSRLRLHNSKLNKPAREQFAVLPRTGNKKRFLCGTVTRTGADGFCRSAFNPAE